MNDIVERARSYVRNLGGPPEDYLVWQLADEIEQLRVRVNSQELEIVRLQQDKDAIGTELARRVLGEKT
jgi:cell division protein FtsB